MKSILDESVFFPGSIATEQVSLEPDTDPVSKRPREDFMCSTTEEVMEWMHDPIQTELQEGNATEVARLSSFVANRVGNCSCCRGCCSTNHLVGECVETQVDHSLNILPGQWGFFGTTWMIARLHFATDPGPEDQSMMWRSVLSTALPVEQIVSCEW